MVLAAIGSFIIGSVFGYLIIWLLYGLVDYYQFKKEQSRKTKNESSNRR